MPDAERLNQTGATTLMGTPSFMPPEVVKDPGHSDPRGDLYAVGALGYHLLTGENVFEAGTFLELYEQHLTRTPVPPSQRSSNPVSAELEAVLLRCLAKDPEARPRSAAELSALLLTSPRAGDWTPERRAVWWARHVGPLAGHTTAAVALPGSMKPTVKIDFAQRTAGEP